MVIVPRDEDLDVLEPTDFRRFSVRAGLGRRDTAAVCYEGGFAWMAEAALRAWPGGREVAGWQDSLTAMIDFACSKGWVRTIDGAIRAHIES
jgi:hypothetical protein